MKLKPRKHQAKAHRLMKDRMEYALFCEQGTGKTYMLLADVERLWMESQIDALLIISPKGVHTNWVRREMIKHWDFGYNAVVYKPGVKYFKRQYEEMMMGVRLRILTINIDAAVTKNGMAVCIDFLKKNQVYMVVDESQRIKNPRAGRTKSVTTLGNFAYIRRIATGTPATNSPSDVFSQMQFLERGLLETNSYRAFVAEYTELLFQHDERVSYIKDRAVAHIRNDDARARMRARMHPQVPKKDALGNPIYRNLDKLAKLLAPHSYRVKKEECLDLPEKIYKVMEFEMSPKHRQIYDSLKENLRIELSEGEFTTIKKLALGTKLQQITSGFMIIDGVPTPIHEKNPRMELFVEIVKDINEGSFVIWAKFVHEVESVIEQLERMEITVGGYYGAVSDKDREANLDAFHAYEIRCLAGNAKCGGVGIEMTQAETVIYYSNDFSLEDRSQSEDRCHRDGTTHHVLYIDIVAPNTIDERILGSHMSKSSMAAAVMGEFE